MNIHVLKYLSIGMLIKVPAIAFNPETYAEDRLKYLDPIESNELVPNVVKRLFSQFDHKRMGLFETHQILQSLMGAVNSTTVDLPVNHQITVNFGDYHDSSIGLSKTGKHLLVGLSLNATEENLNDIVGVLINWLIEQTK